jgi:O-antigen/teichoic acid export membrane protein
MVASNVLTMTGLNKEVAKAAMISVVINLVVSLSLVTTYGLNGVAAGTLIATLLVNVIWIPVLVSRYFNLGFISYWTRILKPLAPPILVNFACCFFLKSSFPSSSLFKIGLLCIPGSLLFIAVWYIFSVESSEKELIRERLFKYKKLEKGDREA